MGWGKDDFGQAEDQLGPFIAIAAGTEHSIALRADGSVQAWGLNDRGQGIGHPGPFIAIAAGGSHNLGLTQSGEVIGWGWNENGQCDGQGDIETPDEERLESEAEV